MTTNPAASRHIERLRAALSGDRPETRLRAALAVGTAAVPELLDTLVERCAVESDFYVRDMLTWAITRYPVDRTVPAVTAELCSDVPQATSQALHTLSKIGDHRAWPSMSSDLVTDPDDDIARSAWRAAVVLVPDGEKAALARLLVAQFGRGDSDTHRSLSRALAALGDAAILPVAAARGSSDPVVAGHAAATEALFDDPESAFTFDVDAARRAVALGETGVDDR